MSTNVDIERTLDLFLAPDHDRLPDRVLQAALDQIDDTPQARRGPLAPWRTSRMNLFSRLVAAAALVAVVVAGGLYLYSTSQVGHPSSEPTSSTLPGSPPPSGAPTTTAAPTGFLAPQVRINATHDGGLLFAFGSLWIGDQGGVQRIDPATNTKLATVPISPTIRRLWLADRAVWVDTEGGSFSIDPATNAATPSGPAGMPAGNAIWSIDASGTLQRFDLASGKETGSVSVQGAVDWQPQMTYAFGSIWIAEGDTHELVRVDPSGPRIITRVTGFSTDNSLLVAGAGFGSVWVQANAAGGSGTLYRIDPGTNRIVATIAVGDPAHGGSYGGTVIAFSQDAVWTADASITITRVDPATNAVVAVRTLEGTSQEWIVFGADALWTRTQGPVDVSRFDAGAWSAP